MKKPLLCAALAAALWVPAAGASQAVADRPAAKADDTKTVIGCVTPGVTSGTFSFSEVASPATPSAASAAPASWTLKADSNIDLSKYVGKKVEITGSADRKGGASDTAASPASTAGPRFHVKSVKVLADTCS
jgi:hypothetical protein